MATQIGTRIFRAEQQDWKIVLESAFGVRSPFYFAAIRPAGSEPLTVDDWVIQMKAQVDACDDALLANLTANGVGGNDLVVPGLPHFPEGLTLGQVVARRDAS
ncbi:MAG: gag protein [Acidobacteriia bacterium]|nr:gag protein [Terriglobia bacterium]